VSNLSIDAIRSNRHTTRFAPCPRERTSTRGWRSESR
jgi:hypothetical protein